MNYSELGVDVADLKKGFQDARKELEDVSEQTKPSVESYLDEFLDFCQYQRSLSENTIRSYRWDLKQWTTWLRDRDLELTRVKIRDVDVI